MMWKKMQNFNLFVDIKQKHLCFELMFVVLFHPKQSLELFTLHNHQPEKCKKVMYILVILTPHSEEYDNQGSL